MRAVNAGGGVLCRSLYAAAVSERKHVHRGTLSCEALLVTALAEKTTWASLIRGDVVRRFIRASWERLGLGSAQLAIKPAIRSPQRDACCGWASRDIPHWQ